MDGETEDQEEEDEENEDSELAEDAKKKNKRPITPPPPRCVTDWTVRPSTDEEKNLFRVQVFNFIFSILQLWTTMYII